MDRRRVLRCHGCTVSVGLYRDWFVSGCLITVGGGSSLVPIKVVMVMMMVLMLLLTVVPLAIRNAFRQAVLIRQTARVSRRQSGGGVQRLPASGVPGCFWQVLVGAGCQVRHLPVA